MSPAGNLPARSFPISLLPAPYDLVWCRFPDVENPKLPGPKARPALVRRSFIDQDGNPHVEVAFGTSKDPCRTSLSDFTISKMSEMDACGLWYATRFRLDRTMVLPYTDEFFEVRSDCRSPVIGQLTEYAIRLLQVQMAYYQQSLSDQG